MPEMPDGAVGERGEPRSARVEPRLVRALGRWDLTALGVNQVIGGAVFLVPAQIAAQAAGGWGVLAFLAVGLASLAIAACFAEVASRFEGTGGPYLFARAAFGRFVGFEVGWMQWVTRVTSQASVANGLVLALGFYWPAIQSGSNRAVFLALLVGVMAMINVRGIRTSATVVNLLTVGKLVPLAVFVVVGVFFVEPGRLADLPAVPVADLSAAALLLVFAYGGYEVVPVPAGETRDPRRAVPFALLATVAVVTVVMSAVHAVTVGTLPGVAASATPVADAAAGFLGASGALLIAVGSVVSMSGNNLGQVLHGARMLFALAERGDLPPWLGRIHPRHHTPSNAIYFTSALALALAWSGSFVVLATASAVARLVTYAASCAATLRLRRRRATAAGEPLREASFRVPGGPWVPVAACALSLALVAGASPRQQVAGAVAAASGAALFAVAVFLSPARRGGGAADAGSGTGSGAGAGAGADADAGTTDTAPARRETGGAR